MQEDLGRFMKVLKAQKDFGKVEFVILHGSAAEGRALTGSDIDLCIGYTGNKKQQSDYRQNLLKELPSRFDVQMFDMLPLYVRKNVLRGKEVYVRDKRKVYDTAMRTIKDYELFRPRLMLYLGEEP